MTDVFSIYAAKNQTQKTLELLSKVFPDNEALQDSVGTLLETKELWKRRLTKTWVGRKKPTYTQWMIRDINFLFKQSAEAEKQYREAANTWEYCQVKEQSWVLKERNSCWRGWCPFKNQYLIDPLEYEDAPNWEVAKQAVIKQEESKAVDIIATMKKLISWGESMGFGESAFEQLFLQFARHELKEGLAGISRFTGNVDKVFEAIASLIHGDYEEAKIRNTLRLMSRPAYESLSILMNKVMSCYMSLYQIKHQNMSPTRQKERVESHCIEAITNMITPECKAIYDRYSRSLVDNGEIFPLLDIIDFISSVETSNTSCAWTQGRNLPLGVSTLDFKPLGLDVKTDMAIHLATVTPNKEEYKNKYENDRGRNPMKYSNSDKEDGRGASTDKNSYQKTQGSPNRLNRGRPTSRTNSKGNSKQGRNGSNRSRRSSKSPARGGGFPPEIQCLRCGSQNHSSLDCIRYTEFCLSRCEDCGLYHERKYCNQRRTNYSSPSRSSQNAQKTKTKQINHLELEDDPIIFVNQNIPKAEEQSLQNNLFRKN